MPTIPRGDITLKATFSLDLITQFRLFSSETQLARQTNTNNDKTTIQLFLHFFPQLVGLLSGDDVNNCISGTRNC